jgi:hypothetical protein
VGGRGESQRTLTRIEVRSEQEEAPREKKNQGKSHADIQDIEAVAGEARVQSQSSARQGL